METLCKMSVIERNVDLLVSTGPWSRFEKFIRILAGLLALNEEIPSRFVQFIFIFNLFFKNFVTIAIAQAGEGGAVVGGTTLA